MNERRKVEIFSAGCPCCNAAIERVRSLACPSCDVQVLDMHESGVAGRAAEIGVHSVPAVAVDGRLAECCAGRGPDLETLRPAGVGQPLA